MMFSSQQNYEKKVDEIKEKRNVLLCHYCQTKVFVQDQLQDEYDDHDRDYMDLDGDNEKECCGVKVSVSKSEAEDIEMEDEPVYDSTGTPVSV